MNKQLLKAFAAAAAALALTACSEAPQPQATKTEEPKKEAAAPVAPVTAQTAFYAIYAKARPWATDLVVLSMASDELPGFKNADGKAAVWKAVLASPSQKAARTFTYAIANAGTFTKGSTAASVQAWGGQDLSFSQNDFPVDSDAAVKTASEKAAEWLKANPDKKLSVMLGAAKQFPAPVWRVQWGSEKAGFVVLVNATTGAIVTK
jgi:hypothetical protein